MATVAQIFTEIRSVIASMAPTDGLVANFLEHLTNDPFPSSPLSGAHGFHVESDRLEHIQAFGRTGDKECELFARVLLGHAPYGVEGVMDNNVSRDIERIADVLSMRAWSTAGVQAVWFESQNINKDDPNWWISTLSFRIIFTGAISTS